MFLAETNLIIGHGMRSKGRERGHFPATPSALVLGGPRCGQEEGTGASPRLLQHLPQDSAGGIRKAAGARNELLFPRLLERIFSRPTAIQSGPKAALHCVNGIWSTKGLGAAFGVFCRPRAGLVCKTYLKRSQMFYVFLMTFL